MIQLTIDGPERTLTAAELDEIKDCLEGGGVVLVPTDTVYGLAVHPTRRDAVARLFAMKRRPGTRNLPIMVASYADLDSLGVIVGEPARSLFDAFSPGALSVALGVDQEKIPDWLHGRVEIAVRIPHDDAMLSILRSTGPLLVTSANIHAEATPDSVGRILAGLDGEPDIVLDGGRRLEIPSTLVNCNLPVPDVERVGVISRERIMEVIG
jgi:L-threonylcarbamoyladenylate synthase